MKKFFKNPCNVYILLSALYSMQGAIIPTGGTILSQFLLLIIMSMSLFYTVKALMVKGKPAYFKGLNLLFLTLGIYGLILLFSNHNYVIEAKDFDNEVSRSSYLKKLFLSLPNIYTFYYFSRKGFLTESLLRKWIFVFLGVAVFRFIDCQISTLQTVLLYGKDEDEVTNNMGYLFVALIPGLAFFKKKIPLQFSLLVFCVIFIFAGMKRGAMLVGAASIVCFLFYFVKYNNRNAKIGNYGKLNKRIKPKRRFSKAKLLIFLLLLAGVGYVFIEYLMDSSDYFMKRIADTQEGNSSGRNEIYEHFWTHFKEETDMTKFVFGNGANATLGIGENYAHNDWLEIAINQGVLGLVVYAIYWLSFLFTLRFERYDITAKSVLTITFLAFFLQTIFSMSYTEYSMMSCTFFGYALAQRKRRRKWVLSKIVDDNEDFLRLSNHRNIQIYESD